MHVHIQLLLSELLTEIQPVTLDFFANTQINLTPIMNVKVLNKGPQINKEIVIATRL